MRGMGFRGLGQKKTHGIVNRGGFVGSGTLLGGRETDCPEKIVLYYSKHTGNEAGNPGADLHTALTLPK